MSSTVWLHIMLIVIQCGQNEAVGEYKTQLMTLLINQSLSNMHPSHILARLDTDAPQAVITDTSRIYFGDDSVDNEIV